MSHKPSLSSSWAASSATRTIVPQVMITASVPVLRSSAPPIG
jgi:hypothetical protein